jgi:DNA transformation protein and related proteins
MAVQPQYLAYVLEQLAAVGSLRPRRMFGAVGLYANGLFFGLIDDDTLYFKTDERTVADYRERSMPRFMPFPDRPDAALGYHQVPADVIEDAEMLVAWARRAVEVALAAQAARPRAKAGPGPKPAAATKRPAAKRTGPRKAARRSRRTPRR